MEHLDGRRPPHARERSEAAMRERSDGLRRAELMVWLTERVARDGVTAPQQVRAMAAEALSSFPEAQVDAEQVLAAARALRAARSAGRSCRRARSWWWSGPTAVHDEQHHGLVVPNLVGAPWAGVADHPISSPLVVTSVPARDAGSPTLAARTIGA
jgi:hypothetical protein